MILTAINRPTDRAGNFPWADGYIVRLGQGRQNPEEIPEFDAALTQWLATTNSVKLSKLFLLRQVNQLLELTERTKDPELREQLTKLANDCLVTLDVLEETTR